MSAHPSPDTDAVGQLMWAYYCGKPSHEIIEDRDGTVAIGGGPQSYFSTYKSWPPHIKAALGYAKGNVLDIGCGAGRFSLYLQKQGHAVVGIDSSPLAIKVCRKRGVQNTKILSVNALEALRKENFDSILMLGNGFGVFGSSKKAKVGLRKLAEISKRDAILIAESRNPYWRKRAPLLNSQSQGLGEQWRIRIRYERYKTPWFNWFVVSPEEMREIAKGSGWNLVKILKRKDGPHFVGILKKYI